MDQLKGAQVKDWELASEVVGNSQNQIEIITVPSVAPSGVQCDQSGRSQTELSLSWQPIEQDLLRGQLKHYTLSYQEVNTFDLSSEDKSNGGFVIVHPKARHQVNAFVRFNSVHRDCS